MKKVIFYTLIILIILSVINYKFERKNDELIINYDPQNEYEETYPIADYVDNHNDTNIWQQRSIIKGMLDAEDFIDEPKTINKIKMGIGYVINRDYEINQLINQLQYKEPSLLSFEELPLDEQNEYHNYGYVGYDKEGNKVQGYASLYDVDGNYSIAISFLNSDLSVNERKAELLADDSNAEKMAYDIIRETQELYGSNLTPEEASQKYYNSTIEQIAGAISYHAIVTLIIDKYDIESDALIRAATTDISLIDDDAFYVNRAY